jgi:hypothetical protein
MEDNLKASDESIIRALDLIIQADWVKRYVHDLNKGIVIEWTRKGETRMRAIFGATPELPPRELNADVWWSLLVIAHEVLGPEGKGFTDWASE